MGTNPAIHPATGGSERAVLIPLDIDPSPPPAGSRQHALGGLAMGTSWSARLLAPAGADDGRDGALQAGLRAELQAELDEIVAQMSHWDERSLLSRFNAAPAGSWHALPPQFFEVIDYALRVHAATGGAYDPGAGALVNLWGFGPVGRYDQAGFYAPAAGAVEAALARRAGAVLQLDRAGRRLLQPGGVLLDLSAVAKGYAVDRLALCLERRGLSHYLVEAGGELRGAGTRPDGQPWWVELEGVPDGPAGGGSPPSPVVALHGLAVATSGDYRRYFHHGPRRLSHTLDPRSGNPIANGVASATVLASTCMEADALSTALTVMGERAALAFADRNRIAARLLLRAPGGLEERCSAAWRELLQ